MADLPVVPVETVAVERPDCPGAPMIINKSDFDPAVHTLYEPPADPPAPEGNQSPRGDNAPKPEGKGVRSKAKTES